jgi:hypothetical protein
MTQKRNEKRSVAVCCVLAALLAPVLLADRGSDRGRERGEDENRPCPAVAAPQPAARLEIEAETRALVEGFEAKLKVEVERDERRAELEAEVENLNFPPGTRLQVCRNGNLVGQMVLDERHAGRLEIKAEPGAEASLAAPGDLFEVRLDACGSVQPALLALRLGDGPAPGVTANVRLEGRAQALFNGFEAELGVKFEQRPDRRRFSAEVENVNLPEGALLAVCRSGQILGLVALDAFHFADLNLDSRRGEFVPSMTSGDGIEIRSGNCTGTLILSATLR